MTSTMASAPAYVGGQASPAAGIPYRHEPAVPVGSMVSILIVTVALLGALLGGLLLAKRFGWLAAWRRAGGTAGRDTRLRIVGSARLSAATRAHVVECDGSRYVVFESSQRIAIQPHDRGRERQDAAQES